ncbi:MAG TPA: hypothetical protein VG426_12315 [Candidatus Dormibacteraeota bacterium]|nr:hypothetical protein [Candidatus Dormibacteraeota bacterium]
MIERFLARVGTFGAILILVVAVFITGLAGAALEHVRLAAHQQQVEQSQRSGESQQGESQKGSEGEQGDSQSQKQSGQEGQSHAGESSSSSNQQGEH